MKANGSYSRRKSDVGLVVRDENARHNRRKTISAVPKMLPSPVPSPAVAAPPPASPHVAASTASSTALSSSSKTLGALSKTPTKHRVNLGHASSYYFKNAPKTPLQKELAAKHKLNASMNSMDKSFEIQDNTSVLDNNNTSYLSSSTSASEDSSKDLLNQSTLSDTTELSAANFVRDAQSRQQRRFSDSAVMKNSKSDQQVVPEKTVNNNNKSQHGRRNSLPPPVAADASASQTQQQQLQPWKEDTSRMLSLVAGLKSRRMQREQEKVQYHQRRFSDPAPAVMGLPHPSPITKPPLPLDHSTTDISEDMDATASKRDLEELFEGLMEDANTATAPTNSINNVASATNDNADSTSNDATSALSSTVHGFRFSPASTVSTKTTMGFLGARVVPGLLASTSPRPLPDAIAFDATATSPFKDLTTRAESKLTPSKLTGSPMRVHDSPARHTRSAEKQRQALLEAATAEHSTAENETNSPERKDDDFEMVDYAARSATKRRRSSVDDSSVTTKRLRHDESLHTEEIAVAHSAARNGSLTSSLRKPGSVQQRRKSVAFGSPKIIEYNKSSPSTSLTPVPGAKMSTTKDDDVTEELEEDMTTLLANNEEDAGSTPFASRKVPLRMSAESSDDSGMSIDDEDATEEMMMMEHTVELENDMESLLENVVVNHKSDTPFESLMADEDHTVELEASMEDVLDAVDLSVSRRRRSSLSTRRFSLQPSRRSSLTGEISVNSSVMSATPKTRVQAVPEPFTLTMREVAESLGISNVCLDAVADALLVSVQGISGPSASEVTMFVSNVQELLESGSDPVDLDQLVTESEDVQAKLLAVQKAIRSGEDSAYLKELQKSLQIAQEVELTMWLDSVAKSLVEALHATGQELDLSMAKLEKDFNFVEDQMEILSIMASKAVRKARRKSLQRRKTAVQLLEEEIAGIESELKRAQDYLDAALDEHALVQGIVKASETLTLTTQALENAKVLASDNELQYSNVLGLGRFTPANMNDSELSFHYLGQNPASCVAVSFAILSTRVLCQVKPCPEIFSKCASGRPTKADAQYLKVAIADLCSGAARQIISSPTEIGSMLQLLEWKIGRLEQTAVELAMLRRRYNAQLQRPSSAGNYVQLEVEFVGKSNKLLAYFEISPSYPFSAVSIGMDLLEGTVDMEDIQKQLIKHAKPGFGYLSRTCDVVAAYVR